MTGKVKNVKRFNWRAFACGVLVDVALVLVIAGLGYILILWWVG
jgi:hypothetical protein